MKPIYPLLILLAVLAGCAETSSVRRPALVEGPTTVRPETRPEVYISPGSLVPVTLRQSAPRRLFEERRANRVGDSLTVILNETTRASKDGGTKASRQGNNSADVNLRMNAQTGGTTTTNDIRLGVGSNGSTQFDSKGGATASNQFSGTITVTVIEVLSNGNMNVAGEKRVAVGAEEEIIRFAGVVHPQSVRDNTVLSSQVADARIEYRGAGVTDEVQRPGWISRLFMKYGPN
jgi:flagellar L-ring protein precursor FlgH